MQEYLPEMGPPKNDRVHNLALRYADLRDERMAANKEEKEAHETLLHAMLEEGLEHYEWGDLKVAIDATRKCKVKVGGEPSEKRGDEGDDE